jgi:hypothetical protein
MRTGYIEVEFAGELSNQSKCLDRGERSNLFSRLKNVVDT